MSEASRPIGEVVESSTQYFVVACYELYEGPAFGSLLKARCRDGAAEVYGIVFDVSTGSEPPGAHVQVRGSEGLRDHEIYDALPDLKEIMCTRVSVLTVGFRDGTGIRQYLPPQPPPLHYSAYACLAQEVGLFSEQLDYLRTILTAQHVPADELAAAAVRQACACRPGDPGYALRAGRQVALLLKDDYDRLRAILAHLG